jgi:D-beta-D-heptose 7-phosphate kinase/D-beta-D-heptose 1-phosphate adenosyltransferase
MDEMIRRLGQRAAQLRALVIGDVMLDSYLSGSSHRLCQEAPVPVVDVAERHDAPGGAGNAAANLAALGAHVSLLGAVGKDCEGELVRKKLLEAGVSTDELVVDEGRQTLFKARVLCDGHLIVRYDQGMKTPLASRWEQKLLERLAAAYRAADVVLISDYSYGVLTPAVIARVAELQRESPQVLVVDARQLPAYRHVGMTACKPNYRETLRLLGIAVPPPRKKRWQFLQTHGEAVLEATGARIAAVSLDREGALFFERGQPPHRTYAQAAPQSQAAGAGDTFLSALAVALAAGAETSLAADIAAAAANVVVAKPHTSTCSWSELQQKLAGEREPNSQVARLLPLLDEYRRQQKHIVLTNGCFDILHRGHIAYLEQAKRLGDVLIVGVNSDASIRRLKGPTRPINTLHDRLGVLEGLSSVDHVVAFDEDTPHALIRQIRPDVFVKGGDYTRETLPEASLVEELGGTVKILPFVSERSTTSIISRICKMYVEEASAAD